MTLRIAVQPIKLRVVILRKYGECHYECRHAEYRYSERPYAERYNADCIDAKCL